MERYGRMGRVFEGDRCMKKYRILLVAYDISLLLILALVKALKKENSLVVIHLITDRKLDSVTREIRDYATRVFFIPRRKSTLFDKYLFYLSFFSISFKKYDIVNVHFPKPRLLKVMPWLKRMSKSIVITPWGSDVFRVENESAIQRMRTIYSYASCVTAFPSSELGDAIIRKFKFDSGKMRPVRWGMDFVDYLEDAKPDKSEGESKARFGINGKYVITCGYSSSPSHRHEAIIDAVDSIREELPKNLTLLFPFTYGWGSEQYVQSIKDKCSSLNLDAVFVEEYLGLEDLYTLRMATDMFVHVQTTDAGAACVMQYILCHKKIVHGSWMKYVDLEQYKPLFYFPVDRMEDLGKVILDAYQSKGIDIPDGVISTIMGRGWNKEIKKWDRLFSSMVK